MARIVLVAAVALIDPDGRVLLAQRPEGKSLAGFWEFPGGKREKDETIEDCLAREALEELGVRIQPERLLFKRDQGTPERRISLFFFFCKWMSGEPRAIDCKDFRWVSCEDIRERTFLPGDLEVLEDLICHWNEYFKTEGTGR